MKNLLKIFAIGLLCFLVGTLFQLPTPYIVGVAAVTTFINMTPLPKGITGINNFDLRMVFDNAKEAIMKTFGIASKEAVLNYFKLTPSIIRLEQPIVAGQTLYTFPILENAPLFSNTEVRLKLQDSAVVYSMAMFTAAPSSPTATNFTLDTYPNTQKYPTGFSAMNSLYNGNMWITVNNDQMITQWDLWRHYNANQTQQTAAAGAGSPLDQNRGSFDAFYPMEPNIVFIGQKSNVIQLILPSGGVATVDANSRIVLFFRVINAQNSTSVS